MTQIYCLKCKSKTDTVNPTVVESNGRKRMTGTCSCGCKKSMFMKSGSASSKPKTTRKTTKNTQSGGAIWDKGILYILKKNPKILSKFGDKKFSSWVKNMSEDEIQGLYEQWRDTQTGGSIGSALATIALFIGWLWTLYTQNQQNRKDFYDKTHEDTFGIPALEPDTDPLYDITDPDRDMGVLKRL